MRKPLLFALFLISLGLFSQAPQKINYQGVARNSSGTALAGVSLTVTIDISGVFTEKHVVTTNAVGIFVLPIGGGSTITGSFGSINWAGGSNNISVTIDSGSGPQSLGPPQQLISVPYALYADKAGSAPSPTLNYSAGVLTVGTNTVPLASSGATSLTAGTNISIISAAPSFTISSNPTLAYTSDTLRISGGNYVIIPTPINYTAGGSISIVGGVISNPKPDLTVVLTQSTNVGITGTYPSFSISATPTLSIAGTQLSISGGNTVILPSAGTVVATPNTSITGTGIANVTTSGTNTFNIQVPGPALSVAGNTITITQGSVSSTQTISTGVTPTITGVGVATVSPLSGNNFTVNVPPTVLNFNSGTGVLSYSPALGTNTISIPGTNIWSRSSGTATTLSFITDNVGLGTLNPTEKLQIQTGANTDVSIVSSPSNGSSLNFGTSINHFLATMNFNSITNVFSLSSNGNANRLFVEGSGRVGIGGVTPVSELDVNGSLRLSGSRLFLGPVGGINSGYTGLYENSGDLKFAVFKGGAAANPPFASGGNSIDALTIKNTNGFVGIGTNAPSVPLEVMNNAGQVGLRVNGNDPTWSSIYINAISATSQPGFGYLQSGFFKGGHFINSLGDWFLDVGGTPRIMVSGSNGNVGIATNPPVNNSRLAIKDGHIETQQTNAPGLVGNNGNSAIFWGSPSTDVAGIIEITTNGATAPGAQATLTFNKPYTSGQPVVIITAYNNLYAAQAISTNLAYVTSTSTGFTINFNTAFTPFRTMYFTYLVIEH